MDSGRDRRDHAGMRRHYTDEQRSELVGLVTMRRATVPQAAARLGVTTSTAYNWVRRAAAPGAAAHRPSGPARAVSVAPTLTFVEVARPGERGAAVLVRVAGTEIEVRHGFDAALLRDVVAALRDEAA
jgi:transposase-like protein